MGSESQRRIQRDAPIRSSGAGLPLPLKQRGSGGWLGWHSPRPQTWLSREVPGPSSHVLLWTESDAPVPSWCHGYVINLISGCKSYKDLKAPASSG